MVNSTNLEDELVKWDNPHSTYTHTQTKTNKQTNKQTPDTKQFGEARPSSSCRLVQIFWRNPPPSYSEQQKMYSLEGKKKVLNIVYTWTYNDHHTVSQLWQDLKGPLGPLQDHKKIMQALITRFTYLRQSRRTEEMSSIYHAYPQLRNIQCLEGSCCIRHTDVAAKHLTSVHTNATQFDIPFKHETFTSVQISPSSLSSLKNGTDFVHNDWRSTT